MDTRINNKKESHLLEVLLPFLGVLAPYKVSIIPVTAIVLLIAFISKIRDGKITVYHKSQPFVIFFVYILLRDVLHMIFSDAGEFSTQANRMIEYSVMYILIFLVAGSFNEDVLYKWWRIAGVIFGAGMLYHVVQILVFDKTVVPISLIPGYEIRADALDGATRPTSFFAEPAAYVNSMIPLLFLTLKRKDLKWAFLCTFLIIVSTSTVGVILSAALWILFILSERKSTRTTVAAILFICVFVVMFFNLAIFSDALEKFKSVTAGESSFGSRIQAPFEVIRLMDWRNLPFGNNVLDVKEFVLANRANLLSGTAVYQQAMNRDSVFLNTIAFLIFRYGIVGLGLFIMCFKNKVFNKDYGARMYAIILLIACFGQGSISDPGIPILLLILYTSNRNGPEDNKLYYSRKETRS